MMNVQEITGKWNQLRGKVKQRWGQLTDDDLQVVEGNIDQTIGRIQAKTGETRAQIERFLEENIPDASDVAQAAGSFANRAVESGQEAYERAKQTATSFANKAVEAGQESYEQAKRTAAAGYRKAQETVERHPATSMAAVFSMGLLAGAMTALCINMRSTR